MSKNNAYLNGQYMALSDVKISPLDRGFLFGDAVYELLCVYDRAPFQLEAHFKRLKEGLDSINLPNAIDFETFTSIINQLMDNTLYKNSTIYLQVTRGCESTRNHLPTNKLTPTVFAFIMPYEEKTPAQRSNGYHAMLEDDIRWARCDIKSTMLLGNILALMAGKAKNEDCLEVLLVRDGYLQEGASSAVFIEKTGQLYTPPLSSHILPSITRQVVKEIADSMQIVINEVPVTTQALFDADNLWIASTTKEISPIITLNNKQIAEGKPSRLWFSFIEVYKERTRQ